MYKYIQQGTFDELIQFVNSIKDLGKCPFRILPKNSSSSSILVTTTKLIGNSKLMLKIWVDLQKQLPYDPRGQREPTETELALEYERKVYIEKIAPILGDKREKLDIPVTDMALLRPKAYNLGSENQASTIHNLVEELSGIEYSAEQKESYKKLLALAIYCCNEFSIDKGPNTEENPNLKNRLYTELKKNNKLTNECIDWFKLETYRTYFFLNYFMVIPSVGLLEHIITEWRLNVIGTQSYAGLSESLEVVLKDLTTADVVRYTKMCIKTLYVLYRNNVVHNDLHDGNVLMVTSEDTFIPLIYDWDRAYVKNYKNPILNDTICVPLCSFGQCNIFNKYLPTDFYKFMYYIIVQRLEDINLILNELKIKEREKYPYTQIVHHWTYRRRFFQKPKNIGMKQRNCNLLQNPSDSPSFVELTNYVGTCWAEIYTKIFGEEPPRLVPGEIPKMELSPRDYYRSQLREQGRHLYLTSSSDEEKIPPESPRPITRHAHRERQKADSSSGLFVIEDIGDEPIMSFPNEGKQENKQEDKQEGSKEINQAMIKFFEGKIPDTWIDYLNLKNRFFDETYGKVVESKKDIEDRHTQIEMLKLKLKLREFDDVIAGNENLPKPRVKSRVKNKQSTQPIQPYTKEQPLPSLPSERPVLVSVQ